MSPTNRLLVWILVPGIMAVHLPACTPSSPPEANPEPGDTLRFDVYIPFGSLNPSSPKKAGSNVVFPLLFSYLALHQLDGEPKPCLALDWQYTPESFTWHITLRRGTKFHDGAGVKAKDVIFSINHYIAPLRPEVYETIDHMTTPAEYALDIKLKKNDREFFKKIMDMEILPSHIPVERHETHPVGSGPYRFLKSDNKKSTVHLSTFNEFHHGCPKIEKIEYHFISDLEESWHRIVSGKTDIALRISPRNYRLMSLIRDRFHVSTVNSWFNWGIAYNTSDTLFKDKRVRQAISHGINRVHIVEKILMGYGEVVHSPFGKNSPFGQPNLKTFPYDPSKGRMLLEAAGWQKSKKDGIYYLNNIPFDFTLTYPNGSIVDQNIANFIKLSLFEMGIRVTLKPLKVTKLVEAYRFNTEYQAVLITSNSIAVTPSTILSMWRSSKEGCNRMGCFSSPHLSDLIERLAACSVLKNKMAICREIESILIELQPISYLFSKKNIDIFSKRISMPYVFYPDYGSIHRLYQAHLEQAN